MWRVFLHTLTQCRCMCIRRLTHAPHTQNAHTHIHVYVCVQKQKLKVDVNVVFVNAVCMLKLKAHTLCRSVGVRKRMPNHGTLQGCSLVGNQRQNGRGKRGEETSLRHRKGVCEAGNVRCAGWKRRKLPFASEKNSRGCCGKSSLRSSEKLRGSTVCCCI